MNYVWKLIRAALATMKPLCSAFVLAERREVPPETEDSFSQVKSP